MSTTYYTSLTGMLAASYGLQNASNNIANMKSSGYKRNDVFYSSLGNGAGHNGLGSGVYVGGQSTNFSAGQYIESGNASDLAIVGQGFFIVRLQNGELLYTRDGEFGFNTEGFLIDKHSGGLVQGYDSHGGLVSISQFGQKISPGKATHSMDLKGEFIIAELEVDKNIPNPDPDKSKYAPIEFSVTVYDDKGLSHKVELKFNASNAPGENDGRHWKLTDASCTDALIDFDEQTIAFYADTMGGASAQSGSNTIQFTLNNKQSVTLNFGNELSSEDSSVRLYKKDQIEHTKNKVEEKKQDGYHFGKQIDFVFDDYGQIKYKYDNGKTEEGGYIALALFDDMENTLIQTQDNLFRAKNTHGLRIGRPNKESFGAIQPKKLETSNVDSTTEFANIVVLQRMFQACSQIMEIDKQLLEEMYKK